jgi:steroid delta-isomerase-like uncharacterized protein
MKGAAMKAEEAKAFVRDYLTAVSGQPKTEAELRKWLTDEDLIKHVLVMEAAFPCYEIDADELIAEEDRVAVRATLRGVHKGNFMGIPASGKTVNLSGMLVYYLAGGKICRHASSQDRLAMLEQLGVGLPRP